VVIRDLIARYWRPKPIDPPTVNPELEKLNGAQRSAEVIKHGTLRIEYWISPNGTVREWMRKNTLLATILAIPAILVLPLVSWIIWLVAGWAMMLVGLAGNLILLPIVALLAVGAIWLAVTVLKAVFSK
jgi:hypothetical protein